MKRVLTSLIAIVLYQPRDPSLKLFLIRLVTSANTKKNGRLWS